MIIEVCDRKGARCAMCSKAIASGSVTVSPSAGLSYHLDCFEPPLAAIATPAPLSSSSRVLVARWLQRRHTQSRALSPVSPSFRRFLLEVLRFLSPREVELAVAVVSRACLSVSRDNALWKEWHVARHHPAHTQSERLYRDLLRAQALRGCWHCGVYVPPAEGERLHTKKPLCKRCTTHPDCRIVAFDFYFRHRLLERSLESLLPLPSFPVKKSMSAYLGQVVPVVVAYAERRRKLLLTHASERGAAPHIIEDLRATDLAAWYSLQDDCYPYECLFLFCGRDERTETLERSLSEFLRSWPLSDGW